MPAHDLSNSPPSPVRVFGRFELNQLLGKSTGTMVWLARDPLSGSAVMLTLPRVQPSDPAALEAWQHEVRMASRLQHPHLTPVAEVGVQDHWPYVAVDRNHGVTLQEWVATHPNPAPTEVATWLCDVLDGLAFAHEAGVAHQDLQLHSLLINERGGVSLMALGAAGAAAAPVPGRAHERTLAVDPDQLRAQRALAARDLLTLGVLIHHLLTGQPALDQRDAALVIARMSPLGREIVRLPWSTPVPIPEALRAIANRCTAGQERLRYQSPRTLLHALRGWLRAQAEDSGGPVGLLLDRLASVGHLPALPGLASRVSRVTSLESQRTDEIADQVLEDMALSFELLRTLHSAQVQGTQVQGNGPVLTLRRIISLIGVNGVRLAANTLREWPGPLSAPQAAALRATLENVQLAARTAQALRPAGYDAQVVYLITALQNLGRLMLAYHFADEAAQIHQLMQAGPADRETGQPEPPGLAAEAAAYAVLGVDVESLGHAVARYWGLGDDVLHMVRRVTQESVVRRPDSDAAVLRLTASAANDAIDAVTQHQGKRATTALGHVAQRYGRALGITLRDLTDAIQAAREALRLGTPLPTPKRGDTLTPAPIAAPARDPLAAEFGRAAGASP